MTGCARRERGGDEHDGDGQHTTAAVDQWLRPGPADRAQLSRRLRPLGRPGPLTARPRLVARRGRHRPHLGRVPGDARAMCLPGAPDRPAHPAPGRPDDALRSDRRRWRPAVLLQRGAVPLGRRRPVAGVFRSGAADRLPLGPQPAAAHRAGARRGGAVHRRPDPGARSPRRLQSESDRRDLGSGRGRLPVRLLHPRRGWRLGRGRSPAAVDHGRHRHRRRCGLRRDQPRLPASRGPDGNGPARRADDQLAGADPRPSSWSRPSSRTSPGSRPCAGWAARSPPSSP